MMTRRQLARRLGLSYSAVSRWTALPPRGRRPTLHNLSAMLKAIPNTETRDILRWYHAHGSHEEWRRELLAVMEHGTWTPVMAMQDSQSGDIS
jgi:transcriptional regulator with XRE-family HTH domain